MPGQEEKKLVFHCQSCRGRIAAPASAAGHQVRCPKCGAATAVPAPRPSAPQAPARDVVQRTCAHCGKVLRLAPKFAGKAVKCPACGTRVAPGIGELVDEVDYTAVPQRRLATALGWGLSAGVHLMLVLVFMLVSWVERPGSGQEEAEVGVVMDDVKPIETQPPQPLDIKAPETTLETLEVESPIPDSLDPIPRLGDARDATNADALIGIDVGIGSGAAATSGHWKGLATGQGGVGSGSANFFGLRARGRKFVYVVDRSASMRGAKLAAAKAEIVRSMRALRREMQFSVIFYNTSHQVMADETLMKASKENLEKAIAWVKDITPKGDTNPTRAMRCALELKPDVVWLLTDGIFSKKAVDAIRDANPRARIQVHTIAFYDRGTEKQLRKKGEPILRRIAHENRGRYRFVRPGG